MMAILGKLGVLIFIWGSIAILVVSAPDGPMPQIVRVPETTVVFQGPDYAEGAWSVSARCLRQTIDGLPCLICIQNDKVAGISCNWNH